jgi:hypothetical protein
VDFVLDVPLSVTARSLFMWRAVERRGPVSVGALAGTGERTLSAHVGRMERSLRRR